MIKGEDIAILIGKSVELICFAQFGVYLHLEGQILLTVEGDFDHSHGELHERHVTTLPASESRLMRVLGCSVVSASVGSTGDLRLLFSNGDRLSISKRPDFESYRLKIGDQELIA